MDGPVALAYQHLAIEPSDPPLLATDTARGIAAVLDGSIDNRSDVAPALGIASTAGQNDAEMLLAGYAKWGDDLTSRLIGTFAFVVWDARARRLLVARDHMGIRPVHYAHVGDLLAIASEPQQVLAVPGMLRERNLPMVAEMLSGDLVTRDETLWAGLARLPGGHQLQASAAGIRVVRWWRPEEIERASPRSDGAWVEELREVLTEAVRCRLPSTGLIWADLSGGVDSSLIVALAAQLAGSERVRTVSLSALGQPWDESRFIDAVADHTGVRGIRVAPLPPGATDWTDQVRLHEMPPDDPSSMPAVGMSLQRAGARTSLTGWGGDMWLTGSLALCSDLLRRGRLLALARRLLDTRGTFELSVGPKALAGATVRPLLARRLPLAFRRVVVRPVPPWIRPAFARDVGLADRLVRDRRPKAGDVVSAALVEAVWSGLTALTLEWWERGAARVGQTRRHAYDDVRVIELAIRAPGDLFWRGTTTRWLHREAGRGLLPELVRLRTSQADFGALFVDELRALGGSRLFEGTELERRGWVDGARLRQMWAELDARSAANRPDTPHTADLWWVTGMESWLAKTSGA